MRPPVTRSWQKDIPSSMVLLLLHLPRLVFVGFKVKFRVQRKYMGHR